MLTKINARIVAILTGTALAIVPMSMGQCDQALNSVLDQVLETTLSEPSFEDGWDAWSYDDETFGESGEVGGPGWPGSPGQPGAQG